MLDIAVAYDRFKFLGHEFLTWLLFVLNTDPAVFKTLDAEFISLESGNRIVLENHKNDAAESITIKGNDPDLKEGFQALAKGALVSELNLILTLANHRWQFTLKGESFHLNNFKPPYAGPVEKAEEIEGAVLEKIYLFEKCIAFIDAVYSYFIRQRLTTQWVETTVPSIKAWVGRSK